MKLNFVIVYICPLDKVTPSSCICVPILLYSKSLTYFSCYIAFTYSLRILKSWIGSAVHQPGKKRKTSFSTQKESLSWVCNWHEVHWWEMRVEAVWAASLLLKNGENFLSQYTSWYIKNKGTTPYHEILVESSNDYL